MFRKARTWWLIVRNIGQVLPAGRQVDQLFRYYVIEALKEVNFFEFLKEPRTYGQILAEFGFEDTGFTRQFFEVITTDQKNVIAKNDDETYQLNPEEPLPNLSDIEGKTPGRYHAFGLMAQGMTRNIPPRLRNETVEISDTFEQDGRQLMTKFDATLGSRLYTDSRSAAFSLLTNEERDSIKGKKWLEIGCGSGRESAELWLKMGGDFHLTAIDPVDSLLGLARERFSGYLDEMDPNHPPLTDANHPVFENIGATQLPYEDNSFDVVFHAFVLHWTPDPKKSIQEIIRVLKPGGITFGVQPVKPAVNPYFNLVIQTNENSYGCFWEEEFIRWHHENGVELETLTPVILFKGTKPQ